MQSDSVFDHLLISSPNGGGLLALRAGVVQQVDKVSTTGIDLSGTTLLRGVQPDRIGLYGEQAEALVGTTSGLWDIHDILLTADGFRVVGTMENVVLGFDTSLRQVSSRRLAAEPDSIHVNCLADWNGRTVYSAFGDFTVHRGYKDGTLGRGFVRDLETDRMLIAGLSQPHSLTPMNDDLLVANSETGEIVLFDLDGEKLRARDLGGYTRGIAVSEGAIFVGLSASRNADLGDTTSARIVALDRDSWQTIAELVLPVKEIYDIRRCAQGSDLEMILHRIAHAGFDWPDWQG